MTYENALKYKEQLRACCHEAIDITFDGNESEYTDEQKKALRDAEHMIELAVIALKKGGLM